MRILIDADGCPVIKESIKTAQKFELEVIIFCDTSACLYLPRSAPSR